MRKNNLKTVALFGGSFDPPHIGHESIVKEILKLKLVDEVVVMPTYLNPFKSKFYAPSSLRLKWLKEIFKPYKNVKIDSYEIDLKRKVASIESVHHLLKKYQKIYLVIGADNLESLSKWYKYDELKELVTFVVATRDNIKVPTNFIKLKVEEDISSTSLRKYIDKSKLSTISSDEITKFYKENNDK